MSPFARRRAILGCLSISPMTVREIGARISLDHTTIHLELANMEREGVVEREENFAVWRSSASTARGRLKVSKFIWRKVA
jgi:predicted ArsR family transcriptional regulator